ncbi:hypothetical protein HY500_02475 [Candidatus Woesearchaeota archaeon]|nr:hypothetical protein [Candidatus Woesearchaeota archaeon]
MINLREIREIIEKSQNPLVFFDDDPDGLCSYLLLEKKYKKFKGVILKNSPVLDERYILKVRQYCPDLILVLDKPMISDEFIKEAHVPIIWIDHHSPENFHGGVDYFNPRLRDDKDNRPVSYWCYKITNDNLWIAMVGIVGDWHLSCYTQFKKKYKDLVPSKIIKNPPEVMFDTDFGKIVKVFSFILKGRAGDVYEYISLLLNIRTPYEILSQKSEAGKMLYEKFDKVNKVYKTFLEKAILESREDKLVVFTYSHKKYSFSSELSNELIYRYPDKVILVGREQNEEVKGSLRSSESSGIELPSILSKSLEGLEGQGGGHTFACGFHVKKQDFIKFKNRIQKSIR